jgi:ComF family protein
MYPYDRVISITAYKGSMAELIQLFKYNNYDYLIELFSALMIKHLLRIGFNLSSYDIITSVPLHISKLKDRGYNQSSILAKSLANYFKIPFRDDIIYEKNQRISQTKLEKKEREENVRGAFLVKDAVIDKKIIIVDDIFTTGSTLKECSISFKEKGAKNITAITLSKTL